MKRAKLNNLRWRLIVAFVVICSQTGAATLLALASEKSLQGDEKKVSCEEAFRHAPQIKVGMRETEVLDLLGEPKAQRENEWDYYWGECLPPPQVGQQMITGLALFFEEGIIKDIKYAWIDVTGTPLQAAPTKKKKKKRAAKSKSMLLSARNVF
jgi:hypothetical protein